MTIGTPPRGETRVAGSKRQAADVEHNPGPASLTTAPPVLQIADATNRTPARTVRARSGFQFSSSDAGQMVHDLHQFVQNQLAIVHERIDGKIMEAATTRAAANRSASRFGNRFQLM